MEGFSTIAALLTRLTHLDIPFEWFEERKLSFWKIIELLTIAPLLNFPLEGEGFTIYNDASNVGLGCIFVQCGGVTDYP
ncbi:hypothetical protein MTR67_047850 [Solanum verrucosum]|uniref:Reverse transcriptase/retrotransposon-derived protein RNase H-like domain-containing protein n=1 Tax=Solanum verrucosum TaxID=315347 RepID=A0AAF0UYK0_SOLVR|nr:hypothetical protein MTR67_047850 [Solanum verrucosum]